MLKRKIESVLLNWKNAEGHKPLVIKGCRQCGKTFSVRRFANENYAHEVYLNFFENRNYASIFSGSLEVDHLTMLLTAMLGPEAVFEAGKTVLILDEIQECPEARTALNFFHWMADTMSSVPDLYLVSRDMASIPVLFRSGMNRSRKCIPWILRNSYGPMELTSLSSAIYVNASKAKSPLQTHFMKSFVSCYCNTQSLVECRMLYRHL